MKHAQDELTMDLFGGHTPPLTGLQIGHAMAKVAADHAGEDWKELAYASFKEFARLNYEFTTEQVREASLHVPPPPDKRAWGFIARQAVKDEIVQPIGFIRTENRMAHGRHVTLWRSIINK